MAKFFVIRYNSINEEKEVIELTPYEYVLFGVFTLKKASFKELSDMLKLQKSTLNRILFQLSEEGYIKFQDQHSGDVGRPNIIYEWNEDVKFDVEKILKK